MSKVVTVRAKELTVGLVTQFGTLKARRKELEKEEKALVPRIKSLLTDDDVEDVQLTRGEGVNGRTVTRTFSPVASPFMLELTEYQAVDVSWKDEFERLYVKSNGQKAYQKFLEQLPLKDCDKLDVRPNPNYKP